MRKLIPWIVPIIAGAIAGAIVALVVASTRHSSRSVTTTVTIPSVASESATFGPTTGMSINRIYRQDNAGVVDIIVTSTSQNPGFGFFGGSSTSVAEGAGVVYNAQGDILTDQHVVANANSVKVNFWNGKSYSAKVLGTDPSTDVGVIKVDAPFAELHPLQVANSATAQVGAAVVAIGSPFAYPETVTSGIVSQTGRTIPAPNGFNISGAIQTDAPINPGNSGGPLLNANGQVLGLADQIDTNNTTTTGAGSSSGVGFATPVNEDVKVAEQIIAGTKPQHAYLGISLNSASTGAAQIAMSGSPSCPHVISPNSPAAAAGLEPGDTITAIDGKAVTSSDQFIAMLFNYVPNQTVTLTIRRQRKTKKVQVKLGNRPRQVCAG